MHPSKNIAEAPGHENSSSNIKLQKEHKNTTHAGAAPTTPRPLRMHPNSWKGGGSSSHWENKTVTGSQTSGSDRRGTRLDEKQIVVVARASLSSRHAMLHIYTSEIHQTPNHIKPHGLRRHRTETQSHVQRYEDITANKNKPWRFRP